MYELPLVLGASVAIIAAGIGIARSLRGVDPLVSVSPLVKGLVLGTALGGPFILERLNLLPVSEGSGWDLVAALALCVVLYLSAARLVGIPDGGGSSGSDSGC